GLVKLKVVNGKFSIGDVFNAYDHAGPIQVADRFEDCLIFRPFSGKFYISYCRNCLHWSCSTPQVDFADEAFVAQTTESQDILFILCDRSHVEGGFKGA